MQLPLLARCCDQSILRMELHCIVRLRQSFFPPTASYIFDYTKIPQLEQIHLHYVHWHVPFNVNVFILCFVFVCFLTVVVSFSTAALHHL